MSFRLYLWLLGKKKLYKELWCQKLYICIKTCNHSCLSTTCILTSIFISPYRSLSSILPLHTLLYCLLSTEKKRSVIITESSSMPPHAGCLFFNIIRHLLEKCFRKELKVQGNICVCQDRTSGPYSAQHLWNQLSYQQHRRVCWLVLSLTMQWIWKLIHSSGTS